MLWRIQRFVCVALHFRSIGSATLYLYEALEQQWPLGRQGPSKRLDIISREAVGSSTYYGYDVAVAPGRPPECPGELRIDYGGLSSLFIGCRERYRIKV
jgi:hypothetical protein